MSLYKPIVVAIVASLLSLGAVQTDDDEFTDGQFLGVWYTIGMITTNRSNNYISCDWIDVAKLRVGCWSFAEVRRVLVDGKPRKTEAYGKITDSEIEYGSSHTKEKLYFFVTAYNNRSEIILHDEDDMKHYILLSRRPTASVEAKAALDQHGAHAHTHPIYISHHNCAYIYD